MLHRLPRFGLIHLLYATAVIGCSVGLFDVRGFFLGGGILLFWIASFVMFGPNDDYPNEYRSDGFPWNRLVSYFLKTGLLTLIVIAFLNSSGRKQSERCAGCLNNLKNLYLALQNYNSVNNKFPPAYLADENGKPMHSWRVLILPFIEQQALYDQYRFDEPWDGPNNRKLVDRLTPECCFFCQDCRRKRHETTYKLVTGPGTAFERDKAIRLSQISDGPSTCIAIMEDRGQPINWMEPGDLSFDRAISLFDASAPTQQPPHTDSHILSERQADGVYLVRFDGQASATGSLDPPGQIRGYFLINDGYPFHGDFEQLPFVEFSKSRIPRIAGYLLIVATAMLALAPSYWKKLRPYSSVDEYV